MAAAGFHLMPSRMDLPSSDSSMFRTHWLVQGGPRWCFLLKYCWEQTWQISISWALFAKVIKLYQLYQDWYKRGANRSSKCLPFFTLPLSLSGRSLAGLKKDTMRDSKIDWQQQELRHYRWLPITGGDHSNELGKKIEVQVGHFHSAQHEHICSLAIYVIYRYRICIRCSDEHELSRSISSTAFLLFS